VPLIYADYYYLEALFRAEKFHEAKPVVIAKLLNNKLNRTEK
jgi:hypothetical protein